MSDTVTQTVFTVPAPCLYVGSMEDFHGEAQVHGPINGTYRIYISPELMLLTRNRESFIVND